MESGWYCIRYQRAIVACTFVFVVASGTTASADDFRGDISDGDSVVVEGSQTTEVRQVGQPGDSEQPSELGTDAPNGPIIEEAWVMDCPGASPAADDGTCPAAYNCPENDALAAPEYFRMRRYQRELDRATSEPLTEWQHVGTSCITIEERLAREADQATGPSLLALVTQEWQRVQIPAATVHINPPDGQTLVNFDTVFYTDAAEQQFPVTLLGQAVVIYGLAEPGRGHLRHPGRVHLAPRRRDDTIHDRSGRPVPEQAGDPSVRQHRHRRAPRRRPVPRRVQRRRWRAPTRARVR